MKVIWTEGAVSDLEEHLSFIRRDSPASARRMASLLYERAMSLRDMPARGRKRSDGTFELLVVPWPFVIVYEVSAGAVVLHGIRHTSQNFR